VVPENTRKEVLLRTLSSTPKLCCIVNTELCGVHVMTSVDLAIGGELSGGYCVIGTADIKRAGCWTGNENGVLPRQK
jgi:hypothetical protein